VIGRDMDHAYMRRLETLILDPRVIRDAKTLRIIYTPLHGTGSVIIKPMARRLGFDFQVVPEQDCFDGRFPTVKSPNPENPEALTMAIDLAEKEHADVVVATDPDCDRLGAAIRPKAGKLKVLTGNQIGSLICWYRIKTLFDKGVLNQQNASRTVIIKTFVTTELHVCAEIMLPIHHQLMSVGDMLRIRHVYSHPQSFAQCRGWLAQHLPSADLIEASSNARAVELARDDSGSAAIGPEIAARAYGLTILASNIEDSPMNLTRFLVLGKHMGRRSGTDKTAVLFSIRDKVGALRDALDVFERHGINLTKIESRPSRRKVWDYVFFVDFVGHPEDAHVAKALDVTFLDRVGSREFPWSTSWAVTTRLVGAIVMVHGLSLIHI